MISVAILIISHKPILSDSEEKSLRQCFKILGHYEITLVCPKGMDVAEYRRIAPTIVIDAIDQKWLRSYKMFNRAKIVPLLYRKYKSNEFILFYELDAWVFRDELQYWCGEGYDYIGAPWFQGWDAATPDAEYAGVGNGGFSLRKVKAHLKVLNSFCYIKKPRKLIAEFRQNVSFTSALNLIANLTIRNNTYFLFNDFSMNEDFFWGRIVASRLPWFKLPSMQEASRFSMEVNAPLLYATNGELPFGCHKWQLYHNSFWTQFIK